MGGVGPHEEVVAVDFNFELVALVVREVFAETGRTDEITGAEIPAHRSLDFIRDLVVQGHVSASIGYLAVVAQQVEFAIASTGYEFTRQCQNGKIGRITERPAIVDVVTVGIQPIVLQVRIRLVIGHVADARSHAPATGISRKEIAAGPGGAIPVIVGNEIGAIQLLEVDFKWLAISNS